MFADLQMTDLDPPVNASKLPNDSPADRFNESVSYQLRDEALSQVVPKMYDPSNVLDDVIHDENRNPTVQAAEAQILKDNKVILRQAVSPPPPQSCGSKPPSIDIPFSKKHQ
jgi:hypothetical protein